MPNWLQASRFIQMNEWNPNSPYLKLLDYKVSGAMLEKYRNSSRSLRWLTSWKLPRRPSGKICHKNTSTSQWQASPSAWLPTWLWLLTAVTLSICGNSLHLQVCLYRHLITNKLALFRPPTDYQGRQRSRHWETGSSLMQNLLKYQTKVAEGYFLCSPHSFVTPFMTTEQYFPHINNVLWEEHWQSWL